MSKEVKNAKWCKGGRFKDHYCVRNRGEDYWYSADGDWWTTADKKLIRPWPGYIRLHGGPRDGEVVNCAN